MTGISTTSAHLDPRRRRILFRSWHRGLREMDLVLGSFAESELHSLDDAELDELERVMAEEDNDLLKWILGSQPVPAHLDTPFFARVAAYRPEWLGREI